MITYMLVVTDVDAAARQISPIITDNVRVDFIGTGQQTIGRHFRGQRYNVIVNLTRHCDLSKTKDNRINYWYQNELLANADKNVKIYDGVDR